MKREEHTDYLNMQLTHVLKAMRDPEPDVRLTATAGACSALNLWWAFMPAQTISKFFALLQQNAFDGAAPAVRKAVLVGLQDLVDNPLVRRKLFVKWARALSVVFAAVSRVVGADTLRTLSLRATCCQAQICCNRHCAQNVE